MGSGPGVPKENKSLNSWLKINLSADARGVRPKHLAVWCHSYPTCISVLSNE